MRRPTRTTVLAALALLPLGGCVNRGADDRVPVDQYQRAELHGPGYTVVAMRATDPARLSGNVVILTNGYEPVFTTDQAWYDVPVVPVAQRVDETAALLSRIVALRQQLAAQVHGSASPATAAAAAPATPTAVQLRIMDREGTSRAVNAAAPVRPALAPTAIHYHAGPLDGPAANLPHPVLPTAHRASPTPPAAASTSPAASPVVPHASPPTGLHAAAYQRGTTEESDPQAPPAHLGSPSSASGVPCAPGSRVTP